MSNIIINRESVGAKLFPRIERANFESFASKQKDCLVIGLGGPSRQGKSSLLNHQFGTNFPVGGGFQPITFGIGYQQVSNKLVLDLEGTGRADELFDHCLSAIGLVCSHIFMLNHLGGVDIHSVARSIDQVLTTAQALTGFGAQQKFPTHLVVLLRDMDIEIQGNPILELERLHADLTTRARNAFLSLSIVPVADLRNNSMDPLANLRPVIERLAREPIKRSVPGLGACYTPAMFTEYVALLCQRSKEEGRVPTSTSLGEVVVQKSVSQIVEKMSSTIREDEKDSLRALEKHHGANFGERLHAYKESVMAKAKEKLQALVEPDHAIFTKAISTIADVLESFSRVARGAEDTRVANEKANEKQCMKGGDYLEVAAMLGTGNVVAAVKKVASHKLSIF